MKLLANWVYYFLFLPANKAKLEDPNVRSTDDNEPTPVWTLSVFDLITVFWDGLLDFSLEITFLSSFFSTFVSFTTFFFNLCTSFISNCSTMFIFAFTCEILSCHNFCTSNCGLLSPHLMNSQHFL